MHLYFTTGALYKSSMGRAVSMKSLNLNDILLLTKAVLRQPNSNKKRRRRHFSKLDPLRLEIMTLHHDIHASLYEIQQWLKSFHNINISRQALNKRIKYWSEHYESEKARQKKP